jgi:uncharacterized repeat protein (TIGR01451 family)
MNNRPFSQSRHANSEVSAMQTQATSKFTVRLLSGTAAAAVLLAGMLALPAMAAVNNTVTVTGTPPSGPPVSSNATESVDVEDSAPTIAVLRTWSFAPGGDVNNNGLVDAGDQIIYTYAVHNSGNVTLRDVTAADVHDGTGAPLTMVVPTSVTTDNGTPAAGTQNDSSDVVSNNDGDWDILGPDDYITFVSGPYTVVPGDLSAPTSSDGDMDGTVTATGSYDPGTGATTVNGTSATPVPLNIVPSLSVSKVASSDTNVPAGTVITYTYRVRNNGTVPLTNVTLSDTHKGVLNALTPTFASWVTNNGSSNTGNVINTLAPGDEAEFTANYTVTQADVDTLQ